MTTLITRARLRISYEVVDSDVSDIRPLALPLRDHAQTRTPKMSIRRLRGLASTAEMVENMASSTRMRGKGSVGPWDCPADGVSASEIERIPAIAAIRNASSTNPPRPYPFGAREVGGAKGRAEWLEGSGFPRDRITPVATACASSPETRTVTPARRNFYPPCAAKSRPDLEKSCIRFDDGTFYDW